MKKSFICLLALIAILFLTGTATAGPEEVRIIPVNKWDHKNVQGYGLYAKGGEYSWFGFILRNPTNTAYTVTLPAKVNIALRTDHEIVNTAYKAMYNGSADFLYAGYQKVYFSESFTLPKDSTYSVFFDIRDIQPYNQQWDTDVFFSIQIKDRNISYTLPIEGPLIYDARNETPSKLTIVNMPPIAASNAAAVSDPLTTVSFCRNCTSSGKKVSFTYSLKNNTSEVIPVELATSIAVEGKNKTFKVTYTGCTSGGSSCKSRISGGIFKLNPGETAAFSGTAKLSSKPSKTNFYIKTSLRYDYNGKTLIPYLVGTTTASTCSANPTAVPTAAPVITATPVPEVKGGLDSVSFCRDYNSKTKKVSFSYTLRNTSSVTIPVELATSLAIEGQSKTVSVKYTGCTSGGSNCKSRISGGIFKLKPGETATFSGTAKLKTKPSKSNFYIRTSLRYDFNGRKLIPFLVGYASSSCSASPSPAPTPVPADEKGLVSVGFCRNYSSNTKKVSFSYTLRNSSSETIPVELATTLAIEGQSKVVNISYTGCTGGGSNCKSRISGGIFRMNPGETVTFSGTAKLPSKPSKTNFYIQTSLRYDYKGQKLIPLLVGYTSDSCTAAHAVKIDEIVKKSAEEEENLVTYGVRLVNDTDTEMTILPGALRIGEASIGYYTGTASFSAVDVEITGKGAAAFRQDEAFVLPPFSIAEISLSFAADPAIFVDELDENVVWDYTIGDTEEEAIPETGTEAKALSASDLKPAEKDDPLQLFPIEGARIPDRLPATGFSARRITDLSVQPETLKYRSLNGLHLDIPAIRTSAEIVQVPLNEDGEWAIEWLNERAGILEDTPLPGAGISVIAAHNHLNDTENGPFIGLSILKDNDRIFVEDNRGRMQAFSVYANLLLGPDDGSRIYEKAAPGSLVLLTCESELADGGYAYRRAVFAEPIN